MSLDRSVGEIASHRDCCFSAGRTLLVSITDVCNQQCLHCMRDARLGRPVPEVAPEFERWLSEAVAIAKPSRIIISGGEPTLIDSLPLVIRMARRHVDIVSICTNAIIVTAHKARAFKAAGLSKATVGLEATGDAYAEFRSSPNGFVRVLSGIDALAKAGIEVTVNITLSNAALRAAGDFANALADVAVSAISVTAPIVAGRAERNVAAFVHVSRDEAVEFARALNGLVKLPVHLRIPRCDRSCGSGREIFSMTRTGHLAKCPDEGSINVTDLQFTQELAGIA